MNYLIEIGCAVYLLIGFLLGTIGPAGKDIKKEVDRIRGTSLSNAFMEREPPSEAKVMTFKWTITSGFILLWPLFIYGIMKSQMDTERIYKKIDEERAAGIWFHYMGGHGEISCHDCHYSEEVTSFIHGMNSSSSGFQCQGCGKLSSIKSGGPGNANEYENSLICDCGGELRRDKVLFCPSCKSKKLSYQLQFIT